MTVLRTLIAALALCGASAQAAIITSASMSRAEGSNIITDSLNNRDWLGWDVTKGLTYGQTLNAIGSGGQFAGYQIARISDAQLFAQALLGASNGCTSSYSYSSTCFTGENSNLEKISGESYSKPYTNYSYYNYYDYYYGYNYGQTTTYDSDYTFFLSDNKSGPEVGLMWINSYSNSNETFNLLAEWSSITDANYYANADTGIGWLLFKDKSIKVPEPASVALVGLALLGVVASRRRQALSMPTRRNRPTAA